MFIARIIIRRKRRKRNEEKKKKEKEAEAAQRAESLKKGFMQAKCPGCKGILEFPVGPTEVQCGECHQVVQVKAN